ncbi:MAG: hypothetical protein ACJAV5_001163 [Vicingaceae bacterium]|jgi:hypothetical protein
MGHSKVYKIKTFSLLKITKAAKQLFNFFFNSKSEIRFCGIVNREEANQTAILTMHYTECCKELFFSESTTHKKMLESITQSVYAETKY